MLNLREFRQRIAASATELAGDRVNWPALNTLAPFIDEATQEIDRLAIEVEQLRDDKADMLKAHQAILEVFVSIVDSGDLYYWHTSADPKVIAARAAIAKATGPPPA